MSSTPHRQTKSEMVRSQSVQEGFEKESLEDSLTLNPAVLDSKLLDLENMAFGPWGSKVLWITLHELRGLSAKKDKAFNVEVYGWLGPKSESKEPNSQQRN